MRRPTWSHRLWMSFRGRGCVVHLAWRSSRRAPRDRASPTSTAETRLRGAAAASGAGSPPRSEPRTRTKDALTRAGQQPIPTPLLDTQGEVEVCSTLRVDQQDVAACGCPGLVFKREPHRRYDACLQGRLPAGLGAPLDDPRGAGRQERWQAVPGRTWTGVAWPWCERARLTSQRAALMRGTGRLLRAIRAASARYCRRAALTVRLRVHYERAGDIALGTPLMTSLAPAKSRLRPGSPRATPARLLGGANGPDEHPPLEPGGAVMRAHASFSAAWARIGYGRVR